MSKRLKANTEEILVVDKLRNLQWPNTKRRLLLYEIFAGQKSASSMQGKCNNKDLMSLPPANVFFIFMSVECNISLHLLLCAIGCGGKSN